jgi:hypothetical protein
MPVIITLTPEQAKKRVEYEIDKQGKNYRAVRLGLLELVNSKYLTLTNNSTDNLWEALNKVFPA